jgi:signal transduction histidine kinase
VGVLTHEVVEILQGNAQQQGVEVGVHVAPDSGTLWLDGRRFKQVMYNLVSNAIKFTPQGGRVRVRVQPDGPHLHVQVQDTGIGIAAEHVGSLFVDFHQLDGSRTRPFEGAGLGLALTRRLVEAQGGEVGVHSTLGQGSEFWVKLPLSRASS